MFCYIYAACVPILHLLIYFVCTSFLQSFIYCSVMILYHIHRYAEEFKPIMDNCKCYSCLHHTRAYIHHLLVTKELLAHTLLMKYVLCLVVYKPMWFYMYLIFYESIFLCLHLQTKLPFPALTTAKLWLLGW